VLRGRVEIWRLAGLPVPEIVFVVPLWPPDLRAHLGDRMQKISKPHRSSGGLKSRPWDLSGPRKSFKISTYWFNSALGQAWLQAIYGFVGLSVKQLSIPERRPHNVNMLEWHRGSAGLQHRIMVPACNFQIMPWKQGR